MRSGDAMPEVRSASPETRRALREARRKASHPVRGAHLARWTTRTVLLTVLAGATIGVPLASAGSAGTGSAVDTVVAPAAAGPSALEVLSSADPAPSVPAAVLAPLRDAHPVSRAVERSPLPGCDSAARPSGANGLIPSSDLCPLWDPAHMLRGDGAVALSELNRTFRATFGRDLCLTDSYRSLEAQRRVARTKPGLAAVPGRSNHGWGLAIDLCSSETGNPAVMAWLGANGPVYGWDNPQWARRGGSGPYEPWHWEYVPGTSEQGTNY